MSEWSKWIEHDGMGCPCRGQYVNAINEYGEEWFGIAGSKGGESWDRNCNEWAAQIIRYLIRRPLGLTILESILNDLPAPTKPTVPA